MSSHKAARYSDLPQKNSTKLNHPKNKRFSDYVTPVNFFSNNIKIEILFASKN